MLLISTADDENDDELLAQVALTVKAGSIYDLNSTVPGMAHFVEHMLFLGSEKYPEENGFDKFITVSFSYKSFRWRLQQQLCHQKIQKFPFQFQSNGGHANAKTDFEQTLYYYFILENSLESSLDRFASLFTSPLLSKDGMTREREAIESGLWIKNVLINFNVIFARKNWIKKNRAMIHWNVATTKISIRISGCPRRILHQIRTNADYIGKT